MGGCDDLLRRRFVAIATDKFDADGTFPPLDVASEVATLRAWLCSPDLGDRRFEAAFEGLAASPSANDIRADLVENNRFSDGDAMVVYITGHGRTDKGRHRTVLATSDPTQLASTALDTVSLIEWLAEHAGLEQVLLIFDLCEAGDVAFEITKELEAAIPPTWVALLTTPAGADAKVGAFTGAVEEVLKQMLSGPDPDASELAPYLRSQDFIARVKQMLHERSGQELKVLREPYRASCCLPNPKYDPAGGDRVDTAPARNDLAVLEQDMAAHWRQRAPVAPDAKKALPLVFTGRRKLMKRLIEDATGPATTVVVTGRAGSGKSAVLARLVTCSDPRFRAEYSDLLAAVPPVPPEDAVDIAVLATGKGPEQIVDQIAGALGARAAPLDGGDTTVDERLDAIETALYGRDELVTLVLDALDESSDPVGVVRTVLQRLNPPDEPRLRLIVGVRSVAEDQPRDERPRDLASLAIEALDAQLVAVDADPYWEPGDVRAFVEKALDHASSPYKGQPERAAPIATAVEEGVGRSYLLAKLVAAELANRDVPLGADDAELADLLAGGAAEVMRQDLVSTFPEADERERAVILLRAAALAFGRGVPWRDVWPIAASAIAPDGRIIGDADIEWLLRHRMAGYLTRDIEDDVTVYRLFHDALRESLARDIGGFAADGAAHPDEIEAHLRIALALLPRFSPHNERPPPYARRHLVEHAASAGQLGEPFLTAETLPQLDGLALSRSLRLIQPDPNSSLGILLGAWRGIRHRWWWDRPNANAAALDMALVAVGAEPPNRAMRSGLSWDPLWAEWSFGGTVIGTEVPYPTGRGLRSIGFGAFGGRALLIAADLMQVAVWDAATSELLGPPVAADARAVALIPVPGGAVVVAGGQPGIQAWDALTGQERWSATLEDGAVYALAGGIADGHPVVAAGSTGGTVTVFEAATGASRGLPFGDGAVVRALAVATDPAGRGRLVAGRGDGLVEQWHLDDESPLPTLIDVGVEVNAVALIVHQGKLLLATGDSSGRALLWDADTGEVVGKECQHAAEIRGVALADASGSLLLATGGFDNQAIVWNPFNGQPSTEPMPHPDAVLAVDFGAVDGRLMLATACADGNVRLWDPVRPSAARVASSGRIQRTALADTEHGPWLAGANQNGSVFVWSATDGEKLATFSVPRDDMLAIKGEPRIVADITFGRVADRAVVAATSGTVARVWDVENHDLIGELTAGESMWSPAAVTVAGGNALVAQFTTYENVEVRDILDGNTRFGINDAAEILNLRFLDTDTGPVLAVVREDGVALLDVQTGAARWPTVQLAISSPEVALYRFGELDVLAFWRADGIGLWDLTAAKPYGPGVHYPGGQNGLAMASVDGQDVLLSGHFATVRAWNPRTGRLVSELPFGTGIESFAVTRTADGPTLFAVSGPGVAVTELNVAWRG